MTQLPFFKMQGAGNDFIVLDNRKLNLADEEIIKLAPKLCDRRFGIGADGVLVLKPTDSPSLDYTMFYRNADGSDAGMCGNGARCLALFAEREGLGKELRFDVHQTIYEARVNPDACYVRVKFPMQVDVQQIEITDEPILFHANTGTEHIVQKVSSEELLQRDELKKRGRYLRYHPCFEPKGTNVNFIYGEKPGEIELKTYERGVEDLTLACGTGAIASGLTWHWSGGRKEGNHKISVQAEGGFLEIAFHYDSDKKTYSNIELAGKAQFVFEGIW